MGFSAPPETIEQAHAEAFARLTPEQRRKLLDELASDMPAGERAQAMRSGDEPGALARVATRAELREPGSMERAWTRMGPAQTPGMGFGGMFAGGLLAGIAGSVLGSMIGQHFFASHPEANHLLAADAAGADLAADPWKGLDMQDASAGVDDDFGGFDDAGSFDV